MEKNKIEIDKLVSQFASSANTLQQAYLSLENELLETYLPETQETKIDYSELLLLFCSKLLFSYDVVSLEELILFSVRLSVGLF